MDSGIVPQKNNKIYNKAGIHSQVNIMNRNLTHKIISSHLIEGEMIPAEEISIKIDQTLTQDATGTMAYLEFEAMNIPEIKTELSVSYVDHNTSQMGFENADDHKYLQTIAVSEAMPGFMIVANSKLDKNLVLKIKNMLLNLKDVTIIQKIKKSILTKGN